MPVTFQELDGSPTASFDDGKFTGKRMFLIDWADWTTFVGELYGTYTLTGGTVSSTSPATFPGLEQAVCTKADVKRHSGAPEKSGELTLTNGLANTYTKAHVTATYRIPFSQSGQQGRSDLPSVPDGTYLDYSSDHGAEYITLPGRFWEWTGTSEKLPEDQTPGILMPTEEIRLTWSRVTSPPWDAIRDTKGTLNTSPFLNHAAGKVLFTGAQARKSFQLTEQTFWTIDYTFRVRAEHWNYYYREGNGWTLIEDPNNSNAPPYASGTFTNLFAFG